MCSKKRKKFLGPLPWPSRSLRIVVLANLKVPDTYRRSPKGAIQDWKAPFSALNRASQGSGRNREREERKPETHWCASGTSNSRPRNLLRHKTTRALRGRQVLSHRFCRWRRASARIVQLKVVTLIMRRLPVIITMPCIGLYKVVWSEAAVCALLR